MIPRLPLPPAPAVVALIVAAFALPGLTVHDPWKPFDVVGIEIVSQMMLTGDWLVPRVAGEAWLEDPPLYHWAALLLAQVFGGAMQFHNAARLASGAFLLAAAWFLHRAGGALAPLLLVGCVGLIVHAHETVPDLATLAFACAALRFALPGEGSAAKRGALFGLAAAGAFLSTGFAPALALLGAVVLAHLAMPSLRGRGTAPFLLAALAVALLVAACWPFALWWRSPALLEAWWSAVRMQGDAPSNLRFFLVNAVWFAWPAWPLAAWAAWAGRRGPLDPQLLVPALAALALVAAAALAGPAQDVNLTAALAPLALLGARGIPLLRRGAANALDWFGVTTFAFFAGLVWFGWFAMMTGHPARMANNFVKNAPGFEAAFDPWAALVALALTAAWFAVTFLTAPSPARSVTRWAAGVALLWGVFSMLWMPWADYIKSYRPVAKELALHLPAGEYCLAQRNVGVPQLAALSYHGAVRARPFDPVRPAECPLLLVQGKPEAESDVPGPRWSLVTEGGRPGDRNERFRLYRYR